MPTRRSNGRTNARRLMDSLLTAPFYMDEGWYSRFAQLAEEVHAHGGDVTADELRERLRASLASLSTEGGEPEAVAADYGEPLGKGLRATVRDGVAIIPIRGPLFHYAGAFDDVCGCTSYEQITRDLEASLEAPHVHAILFEVDSPGGETAGANELAEAIYSARNKKPSKAYVPFLGASAAYLLGSSAGELIGARSSITGSIGVVMSFVDTSERDKKSGVRRFEILSSQSPNKRADPETESGRAQIQQMLDDLAQVLIEDVARNMGVSVEKVLSDFGQGGIMVGPRAEKAGLIHRIGSFETVLAELAEQAASPRGVPAAGGISSHSSQEPTMAEKNTSAQPAAETAPAAETITAESIAANHPQIAEQLRAEGATRERERILGIEEYAIAGFEQVITEAKKDPACTPEMAAARVLKAQKAADKPGADKRRGHLRALAADENQLDAPAAAADADAGSSDKAQIASILNAGKPLPAASNS